MGNAKGFDAALTWACQPSGCVRCGRAGRCFGGCLKNRTGPLAYPGRRCACPGLEYHRPIVAAQLCAPGVSAVNESCRADLCHRHGVSPKIRNTKSQARNKFNGPEHPNSKRSHEPLPGAPTASRRYSRIPFCATLGCVRCCRHRHAPIVSKRPAGSRPACRAGQVRHGAGRR